MSPHRVGAGFTLIETVIALTIVAVALTGVLLVVNQNTSRSADPMLVTQATAVAQAYLEEALLHEFTDPDGSEAGENRASFDDVGDYHALALNGCLSTSGACPALGDCACDQLGAPIDDLLGYNVAVSVAAVTLNGAPARRVDVRVTHDRSGAVDVVLSGFRTSY